MNNKVILVLALLWVSGCTEPLPALAYNRVELDTTARTREQESHLIPAERVATAIYFAEGGKRARRPYGVLSVPVRNEAEARAVTIRSIQRSRARWIKAGRPGDWLEFMAARWIPRSVDPVGHRNWLRNVRYFLSLSQR